MRACAKVLSRHRSNTSKPSTSNLIQLMRLVPTLNNFVFNDKHYIQTGGTAMGTQLAPSYANLFMADFEDRYVYTYTDQLYWWKRYKYNIFLLWTLGRDKLDTFINYLNQCHPTIKFTVTLLNANKQSSTQSDTPIFLAITNYYPLGNPLKRVITSSWKLSSRSYSTVTFFSSWRLASLSEFQYCSGLY